MRRLQPLPPKAGNAKPTAAEGSSAVVTTQPAKDNNIASLKSTLDTMRSEIAGLEQEELIQRQTALQMAQERLKQRRRSDLAKRMQEAQRLQVLRERRAELDDTRRDKVIHFKKAMLAAAERSLERESQVVDILYQNIGEAMIAQDDVLLGDDDEEADVFEVGSAIDCIKDGDDRSPQRSPAPALPNMLLPHEDAASYGGALRIPSAFEAHWTAERKHFSDQMKSLKMLHKAPKAAENPETTIVTRSCPTAVSRASILPPLPVMGGRPLTPATTEKSEHPKSEPSFVSEARREHLRVREELKRLMAQSRGVHDVDDDMFAASASVTVVEAQPPATITVSEPASMSTPKIEAIVKHIEEKEVAEALRRAAMSSGSVPMEDLLHPDGRIIQENAEANIQRQRELDQKERDRQRQEKEQETARMGLGRSGSLFMSTTQPSSTFATVAPGSSKSMRKVSVIIGGEGTLMDLSAAGEVSLIVGSPTLMSGDNSSGGPAGARKSSIMFKEHDAAGSDQSSSWSHAAPQGATTRASAARINTLNASDRDFLEAQQLQTRFLQQRTAQRDELKELKRRLQELERENYHSPAAPTTVTGTLTSSPSACHSEEQPEQSNTAEDDDAAMSQEASVAALRIQCVYRSHRARAECALRRRERLLRIEAHVRGTFSSEVVADMSTTDGFASLPTAGNSPHCLTPVMSHAPPLAFTDAACASETAVDFTTDDELKREKDAINALRSREELLEERRLLASIQLRDEAMQLTSLSIREEGACLLSLVRREDLLWERSALDRLIDAESTLEPAPSQPCEVAVLPVSCTNLIDVVLPETSCHRIYAFPSQDAAATVVQRHVRGYQVRRWYLEVRQTRKELLAVVSHTVSDAVIAIQRWLRGLQPLRLARYRVSIRKKLAIRYRMCSSENVGSIFRGFGLPAGFALLCYFRRLRNRRLMAMRRQQLDKTGTRIVQSEAAASIQREWRRYDIVRSQRSDLARALVISSAQTAEILNACGLNHVKPRTAVVAATIIAKFARRLIAQRTAQQRWSERLLETALAEAEAIRLEARFTALLDEPSNADEGGPPS